jgi:hypothetical protein
MKQPISEGDMWRKDEKPTEMETCTGDLGHRSSPSRMDEGKQQDIGYRM